MAVRWLGAAITSPLVQERGDMSKSANRLPYVVGWGIILAFLCGVLVWKVAV